MGACISEKPIPPNHPRHHTEQPPCQPSKISTVVQDKQNPQYPVTPKKGSPSKATAPSQTKIDSAISMQQALQNENFDIDLPSCLPMSVQQWMQQHNTRSQSVIIKKGNNSKKKQQSSIQKTKHTIQSLTQEQSIQVGCRTQRRTQQFTISSKEFDIEFTLPRCRAGPLVVPHIDFERYYLA